MTDKFIVENTNVYKEKEKETKEDILLTSLKKCVGNDGFIQERESIGDGYKSFFFGLQDNYIYSFDAHLKSNYLKIDLSFGSIEDFVKFTSVGNVLNLVNSSNEKYRVSKAIIKFNEKEETSFLVTYEAFLYPEIDKDSLDMHLEKSMKILENHSSFIMRERAKAKTATDKELDSESEAQKNIEGNGDDNHQ